MIRSKLQGLGVSVLSVSLAGTLLACGGRSAGSDNEASTTALAPEVLTSLSTADLELPEGISADSKGALYATLAPTGGVIRVAPDGRYSEVASLALPPPLGMSYVAGIVHDDQDAMYVAATSADQGMLETGVYRIPAGGGEPELFTTSADLEAPNGLTWGSDDVLFVGDSRGGAIFVSEDGAPLVEWLRDPLLQGDRTTCDEERDSDTGVNGMAVLDGVLYVVNSDFGTVVRIPLADDGSAGEPELWVPPACERHGIDGLIAADGLLYATVNRADEIIVIDPADDAPAEVNTYAAGEAFDFPASLTVWTGRGDRELAITNFALAHALAGEPSAPGIATVPLPR